METVVSEVDVPDWHREILVLRLEEWRRDPSAGEEWDVVRERLRAKLEQRSQKARPSEGTKGLTF